MRSSPPACAATDSRGGGPPSGAPSPVPAAIRSGRLMAARGVPGPAGPGRPGGAPGRVHLNKNKYGFFWNFPCLPVDGPSEAGYTDPREAIQIHSLADTRSGGVVRYGRAGRLVRALLARSAACGREDERAGGPPDSGGPGGPCARRVVRPLFRTGYLYTRIPQPTRIARVARRPVLQCLNKRECVHEEVPAV
jgi:hypothetical protein